MISYFIEYNRYASLLGVGVILFIAFLFSNNKKHINIKTVISSLFLLFVLGFATLKSAIGQSVLCYISDAIAKIYMLSDVGAKFVFGSLVDSNASWGFIFGLKVLPVIIFFGALMSVLFYLGVVQKIVSIITFLLKPILGTSGAETLCAVANSFLGQTEAPLLIRNYLSSMTNSEIFVVMVSGMATISGAILAVFAMMGVCPRYMLAASAMAIPASILIAKIMYPETEVPVTSRGKMENVKSPASNIFDAIALGTFDGLSLAMNVGAMLIVFISLIAFINSVLISLSGNLNYYFTLGLPEFSLQYFFSYLFAPFGYLLGFEGTQIFDAAQLLGIKVTVNEMIAYQKLGSMNFSERGIAVLAIALCGFSNFSCIGIQVGGIGALVPEKRKLLTELGLKVVLASSMANLLSAMVANLVL